MAGKDEAAEFWKRAVDAIALAQVGVKIAPDGAANRAYYAAFHAASALFALEGAFSPGTAPWNPKSIKELVRTGRWGRELGESYVDLHKLRNIGDYVDLRHVSSDEAASAVEAAVRILKVVHDECPDVFPLEGNQRKSDPGTE